MAGKGNVPKGGKEKTTTSTDSYNVIEKYDSELVISGTDSQDRIYVVAADPSTVPVTTSSGGVSLLESAPIITISGGGGGDWIYLAKTPSATYVDGGAGTDWVSFQNVSSPNMAAALQDYYADGVVINLGGVNAQYAANGRTVQSGTFYAKNLDPSILGSAALSVILNVENVWGSAGDDLIIGSKADNELHGGSGNDFIDGVEGNNLLYGEEGDDILIGGKGNNSFNGGPGNDWVQSGSGNDWIEGDAPNHGSNPLPPRSYRTFDAFDPDSNLAGSLSPQSYGDTVDYSYLPSTWTLTVTLNGALWVEATIRDDRGRVRERDKIRNVENLSGGTGNDPTIGDSNGNLLDGGKGNDTVDGGAGDDLILGAGGGDDDINGGDGDDELSFVPVSDPITNADRYSPANNKLNDDKSLVLDLRLDGGRGRYSFNTVETSAQANQSGSSAGMLMSVLASTDVDNPWRGAVSSIERVVGTEVNDQIAGTTGANELNGYAGNDLLYGAGGNDTLRGGEGNDWVLFRDATQGNQPKYTDNLLNVDPVVSAYNDTNDPYQQGGYIRLDTGIYGLTSALSVTSVGLISSVENVLGSVGNDTIVGDSAANILVGEAGKDVIYGGSGADRIFGGANAGAGYDSAKMNSLWGGADNDSFFVGFNYNPVVGTAKIVAIGSTTGKVNSYGVLPTEAGTDYGIMRIAGKDGATNFDYHDVIQDWQTDDSLFLAKDWTVVINGLGASNGIAYSDRFFSSGTIIGPANYDWSGNDTVNLGSINGTIGNNENKLSSDYGKIVVVTGDGNDIIYGSNGNDWIFAGTGLNDIFLGDSESDGADRVIVDTFQGEYNITGFDSDDTIWIDRRIVESFKTELGITTPVLTWGTSVKTGSLTTGQGYDNGSWFTSEKLYDVTYGGILGGYQSIGFPGRDPDLLINDVETINGPSPYGWSANGAWNNDVHQYAYILGKVAVITGGGVSILIGNGLAGIPFVGPFLAIPLWVNGGLMLNDGINNVDPHRNPTYGNTTLDYGVNILSNSYSPGSTVGTWDSVNFMSFYQTFTDKFAPSLEFTNYTNADQADGALNTDGIASFVTVYNGTETFIYLVFSKDGIIQNNETRLIAQVNGEVSASQIKLFDGAATTGVDGEITRYLTGATTTPVFAPEVSSITIEADSDEILPDELLTEDSSPTVLITLNKVLADSDTLTVALNGVTLTTGVSIDSEDKDKITALLPDQSADGNYLLSVSITNNQGFQSNFETTIRIDAKPIPEADITVQSNANGIALGFRQDDPDTLAYDGADTEDATVKLTLSGVDTPLDALLNAENGYSDVLEVSAQTSIRTGILSVTDALGRETTLSGYRVGLGTDGVVGDAINGIADKVNLLYGFGGNDTLTAGDRGDEIYGGDGNDTLTGGNGNDFLDGGDGDDILSGDSGNDILVGGLGTDEMTGGAGNDVFVWNGTDEFEEGDVITDFKVSGSDKLQFNAVSLGSEFYTSNTTTYEGQGPDGTDLVVVENTAKQLTGVQFESGSGLTAATSASTRFFFNETTGDLYFDADGFASGAKILVVTLTGTTALSHTDILLA